MKTLSYALLASVSALAFATDAFAGEDPKTVPTIVISANRGAPIPLNQVASSVTVITSEQIEREHKQDIAQILREVPGISVSQSGTQGQNTSLFMRGTPSPHVLVIIDGIVMNDPSSAQNAFDFSNLNTDNIERIEVLRGPQSTLYGTQAIGGVINVFTKQGKGAPKHTAFAEYGRYNSSKVGVGTSGEVVRTSYSFTASNRHTDGVSSMDKKYGGIEKDGSNNYTFTGNIANKLTDYFTAKINARYNRLDTQIDNPSTFSGFTRDNLDTNNDTKQFNVRAAGELTLMDGKWTQELGISHLAVNRTSIATYFEPLPGFSEFLGHQQYIGWRDTIDWIHHIKASPDNLITVGAEVGSEHYKYNSIETPDLAEINVDNKALFIDDQFNIGKNFYMNVGGRVDDHQAFGKQYTYKLAPGYTVAATGTRLKASYGTGFRAPALFELYDPQSGNATVKPEKSKGWDAGFEQALMGDKITFGSTVFFNNITNLIDTVDLGGGRYGSANVNKTRTEGVESVFKYRPTLDWSLNATYTYTLAQQHSDKHISLNRKPKHLVTVGSNYAYNSTLDVGANARYASAHRDSNYSFAYVRAEPFALLDLYANYKLRDDVTLYGRLDNVFDKHYYESWGYGQAGRSLIVGAKGNF